MLFSHKALLSLLFLGCFGLSTGSSVHAASALHPQPIPPVIPNDHYWNRQWYLRQIHMPEAWAIATGTRPVTVAVIDAGIDITHPDLRQNIWTNTKEIPGDGIDNDANGFIDDVHGWNFVSKSADVRPIPVRYQEEEAWSHGTFIASIIGSQTNNEEGIAGVNGKVRLMPLVALDGDGYGQTGVVVEAIRYAVNQGADIINLSLAGPEFDPALEEMIQRANDAGVLVVAATGNDDSARNGRDIDHYPVYPVCMDGKENNVLGVGGTDTLDQKSPYANYGHRCTDLSAPAQEFFAARPSYSRVVVGVTGSAEATTTPRYLDGMTGTSLAAPLVSGVASLIKAARPATTPAQMRSFLIYNADRIEENLTETQRGKMGSGRLNAYRALQAALNSNEERISTTSSLSVSTSTQTTSQGLTFSFRNGDKISSWIVTQRPLASGWTSNASGTGSVAYAIFQDRKGYEWRKWDPATGKIQTKRLSMRGEGWKPVDTQVTNQMRHLAQPKNTRSYLINVLTGQEKRV